MGVIHLSAVYPAGDIRILAAKMPNKGRFVQLPATRSPSHLAKGRQRLQAGHSQRTVTNQYTVLTSP